MIPIHDFLIATILALCTLPSGSYRKHVRERDNVREWASDLASYVESAASETDTDPVLLVALYEHESGFNEDSVSEVSGAIGISMLNPRAWPTYAAFIDHPLRSERILRQVLVGAMILRRYRRKCGKERWRSIYGYRHGYCGNQPDRQTLKVLETYRRIRR